jgi:hypothetical protein
MTTLLNKKTLLDKTRSSSLQRRVRDLRVAAQHVAVHPRHYVTAGTAVLARMSSEQREV